MSIVNIFASIGVIMMILVLALLKTIKDQYKK